MKHKGIYYCLGSLCILTVLFTCCYYISYKMALNHFNHRSIEQTKEYSKINQNNNDNANIIFDNTTDIISVDAAQSMTVKPTTAYILEVLDAVKGTKDVTKSNPPSQFVGLTKEEITDYLSSYMNDMTLSDYEKGLVSFELVSFSDQSFTVQKVYDSNQVEYKFYVCIYESYVTVYYSDLKTVYEYTMINAQELPEKDRIDLSKGIFVKDEAALYSLLEGLSS